MSGLDFRMTQIIGWLKDAGLNPSTVRDLTRKPSGHDEILTVTIWLAERPDRPTTKTSRDAAAAGALAGGPLMIEINERKSKSLGSGDILASFEFFPPKTEKMEETLWSSITRLAPLWPGIRLGHVRRRRLDARTHARDCHSPDP